MAKPVNLYQGSAPAAMAQMGQGISEAGARIGQIMQGGYESMGKGLAKGIDVAAEAYKQNKQEQARFDATKKMYKAFESFIPDEKQKEAIQGIFDDTSMSVAQKNQLAPLLMSYLGASQQQYGKERIANIMTNSREAIAAANNPTRPERPAFSVAPTIDPLDQVVDQAPAAPTSTVPYMLQMPQGQPQPTQGSLSNMPKTRLNPQTGKMQFWSPEAKRYIDEPEDDLVFGTDFRIQ